MGEEKYVYTLKCNNPKCNKKFPSHKASTMFCGTPCQEEYFEEKYKK